MITNKNFHEAYYFSSVVKGHTDDSIGVYPLPK